MKVIWNHAAGPGLRRLLEDMAGDAVDLVVVPEADDAQLFAELADTNVLLHCLRPVDTDLLAAAPQLQLVQKVGVGLNTIDLDACRARDIAVCNMPGSNSQAVAEHVLALLFAVLRRVRDFDAEVRKGRGWAFPDARQDQLGEVAGRTVGLLGYGDIPMALAPVLRALGARVVYHARSPRPDSPDTWLPLTDLLEQSDILSLHLPLTAATRAMIDAVAFSHMREGAVLVNTARGGLVDETALLAALRDGPLGGAGLDVFSDEPLPRGHPLTRLDNVVLSPHVAWLTTETLERSVALAAENWQRLARGDTLLHRQA